MRIIYSILIVSFILKAMEPAKKGLPQKASAALMATCLMHMKPEELLIKKMREIEQESAHYQDAIKEDLAHRVRFTLPGIARSSGIKLSSKTVSIAGDKTGKFWMLLQEDQKILFLMPDEVTIATTGNKDSSAKAIAIAIDEQNNGLAAYADKIFKCNYEEKDQQYTLKDCLAQWPDWKCTHMNSAGTYLLGHSPTKSSNPLWHILSIKNMFQGKSNATAVVITDIPEVTHFATDWEGATVAIGCVDNMVRLLDLKAKKDGNSLQFAQSLRSLAILPNATICAAFDTQVDMANIAQNSHQIMRLQEPATCFCISAATGDIFTGTSCGALIHGVPATKSTDTYAAPLFNNQPVTALGCSHDAASIAIAHNNNIVCIVRPRQALRCFTLKELIWLIKCRQFSSAKVRNIGYFQEIENNFFATQQSTELKEKIGIFLQNFRDLPAEQQ